MSKIIIAVDQRSIHIDPRWQEIANIVLIDDLPAAFSDIRYFFDSPKSLDKFVELYPQCRWVFPQWHLFNEVLEKKVVTSILGYYSENSLSQAKFDCLRGKYDRFYLSNLIDYLTNN